MVSMLTVVMTAMVMFGNSLQVISLKAYILFSIVVLLVSATNLIFYRLLEEQMMSQDILSDY
jgi:hypothetical protein